MFHDSLSLHDIISNGHVHIFPILVTHITANSVGPIDLVFSSHQWIALIQRTIF